MHARGVWPGFRFRLECDDVITLLRNSYYYAIITQFTPFCNLIGHDKILVRDKLSQRKPGQTVFFQRFLRPPIKKLTYTPKNTVWFTRLAFPMHMIPAPSLHRASTDALIMVCRTSSFFLCTHYLSSYFLRLPYSFFW